MITRGARAPSGKKVLLIWLVGSEEVSEEPLVSSFGTVLGELPSSRAVLFCGSAWQQCSVISSRHSGEQQRVLKNLLVPGIVAGEVVAAGANAPTSLSVQWCNTAYVSQNDVSKRSSRGCQLDSWMIRAKKQSQVCCGEQCKYRACNARNNSDREQ